MPINKELYKKAFEYYRQWNEEDLKERIRQAGELTPEEGWERYRSLVEFCWELTPKQSLRQQKEKVDAIIQYYDRIKKFQTWAQNDETGTY